jgi:hypothetical protein
VRWDNKHFPLPLVHNIHRYSPSEVYRIFEGAVAKPILALQDNIPDDIYPEVTIKDLGLLVRAPVAAIAIFPYILSAGVWLFLTKVFFR